MRILLSGIALALWHAGAHADAPPPYPKVQCSISLHPESVPVLPDPDYHTWVIGDRVGSSTFEIDGLSFTLKAQGTDGNEALGQIIGGANDKVYTDEFAPYGQRLVGSGITTVAKGRDLRLEISGLPEGTYWLTTWFNGWEEAGLGASVQVNLNGLGKSRLPWPGSLKETVFEASVNAIDIKGGSAVVVYTPVRTGSNTNLFMTGFEINGISAYNEISYPTPFNHQKGVVAEQGEVTALWKVSRDDLGETQFYNIYFGASPDKLESVSLGGTTTSFVFKGLESGKTYYWRVDTLFEYEIVNDKTEYWPGRTLEFTVA